MKLFQILKVIWRDPGIIPFVIFVFFLSTFATLIAVMIPISLLEKPLLYWIDDVLGWNLGKNDLRLILGVGFAFWLGFYWARKEQHPNFLTHLQNNFSNKPHKKKDD